MSCFSFGHLRARILITYDVKLTYRPNINTEPLVLITTKFCYCFLTVIGNIVYEKRRMWGTDCSNLLYFLSNRSVGFFLVSFVLDTTYFIVSIWISCIYKKKNVSVCVRTNTKSTYFFCQIKRLCWNWYGSLAVCYSVIH